MGSHHGAPDEKPVHEVCVDGFWMGKYEVTRDQWWKIIRKSPAWYKGDNRPVNYVSWDDILEFIQRLNERHRGRFRFRLPTEAEWEYACRAGTTAARYWGNNPDGACRYANVADQTAKRKWPGLRTHNCDDGFAKTAPVGSFQPNGFGLYDMLGNVWEWCADRYSEDAYTEHQRNNPVYSGSETSRVIRGGGWISKPEDVRCAGRLEGLPASSFDNLGFRLVRIPME